MLRKLDLKITYGIWIFVSLILGILFLSMVIALTYTQKCADMTSANTPSPNVVSADSHYTSTYAGWKAFDRGSEAVSFWGSYGGALPHWLKYDFGSGNDFVATRYTLQTEYGRSGRAPSTFKFRGSNNGADWTDLDSQTSLSWNDDETKTFDLANTISYRYYMVYVTVNVGGTLTAIGEAEIYETDAPVDTCTCAGAGNDWEINHSDYCNITDACDLTTGTLSFTGTGITKCDAVIKTTNLGDPGATGILKILSDCLIWIKGT